MEALRRAFEEMGFGSVRTVLASGNVIFETASSDTTELERRIEKSIPRAIGFQSHTLVFEVESLQKLALKKPFRGIKPTSQIKRYVTFVKGDQNIDPKLPFSGNGFTILEIVERAVCSVVDLSRGRTSGLMRQLDKMWKVNTTRGWNTIERILK